MTIMAAAAMRLRFRQGRGGGGGSAQVTGLCAVVWSREEDVQTQPDPSPCILAPFITGLDPFKTMTMSVAVAKRLHCRQG